MVETAGPLATMWRSVYRKAAEAAAARMGELLRDHVYLFHRNLPTSGGGGGGGLVLLAEHAVTASSGEWTFRLPASGDLSPSDAAAVLVLWQARSSDTGGTGLGLMLRLNDDDGSNYRSASFTARSNGSTTAEGTTTGVPSRTFFYAGRLTGSDGPAGAAGAGRVLLPQAGRSAFWQPLLGEAVNAYGATVDTQVQQSAGHWMQAAAVTSITCMCLDGNTPASFAPGSHVAVYGVVEG